MSDNDFDDFYDPLATPNPAYDDDTERAPARLSSWDRRGLAQALLARARARQDAIANAFVDAILDGKISLFRLLIDLEQAAVSSENEAEEAHLPTLAEVLIPMLEHERKQAAASREAQPNPEDSPESNPDPETGPTPTPCAPRLPAPTANPAPAEAPTSDPERPAAPAPATLPNLTGLHAIAERPPSTVHHPHHCRRPVTSRAHPRTAPSTPSPHGSQRSSKHRSKTGNTPQNPLPAPAPRAKSPSG